MIHDSYDLIIIGGGPAGMTAGIYAARARLKTLLLERLFIGGQVSTTYLVENYPGFPDGLDGPAMMELFAQQAKRFGTEIVNDEVMGISLEEGKKMVQVGSRPVPAGAVIIATGSDPRKLSVPGEKELGGRGVSYCATCDGALFPDVDVAVVGGGDAAVDEALFLSRFAKRIFLIHRRDKLRSEKILQERLFANNKIETIWDTVVERMNGEEVLKSLTLTNVKTGKTDDLKVEGVFISIGHEPNTNFVKGLLQMDAQGYIITKENMQTSITGIFAAGDVRAGSTRQIATAVGDGSVAAMAAEKYLAAG